MNDSLLLIDNIKVPKVPFNSTVFVFQSNNKTYIRKIHSIFCTSKYTTVKFITSLEK